MNVLVLTGFEELECQIYAKFMLVDLLDKGNDIADFMRKINMFTVGKAVIGFVLKGTYACDSMWII